MRKTLPLLAIAVATSLLYACGGAAKSAAPAPSSSNTMASTTTSSIGVPACDDYVKKYLECVESKVPDAARVQYKTTIDQAIAGWRQVAATPEGRAGLTAACTQAEAAAKQAMTAYGCAF